MSQRTLLETTTALPGAEVLARAKQFFPNRPSLYSTFIDKEGPGYATFRGQGGEEKGGEGDTDERHAHGISPPVVAVTLARFGRLADEDRLRVRCRLTRFPAPTPGPS